MMTIVVLGRLNWFYRNFRFEEFKVLSNISSGSAGDNPRYWKDCQPQSTLKKSSGVFCVNRGGDEVTRVREERRGEERREIKLC